MQIPLEDFPVNRYDVSLRCTCTALINTKISYNELKIVDSVNLIQKLRRV